jgi:hypothetical protein
VTQICEPVERSKLETLLAKHTLQGGLYHKTIKDNADLKELNEHLFKEKETLSNQIVGLTEELEAMHEAWRERDVRQRAQVGGGRGTCGGLTLCGILEWAERPMLMS